MHACMDERKCFWVYYSRYGGFNVRVDVSLLYTINDARNRTWYHGNRPHTLLRPLDANLCAFPTHKHLISQEALDTSPTERPNVRKRNSEDYMMPDLSETALEETNTIERWIVRERCGWVTKDGSKVLP